MLSGLDGRQLAAIFAGGYAGAIARTALLQAWPPVAAEWPWATVAANVAGAFLLGLVVAHLQEQPRRSLYWRSLLGPGFCGALTTFSTLQLELLQMLDAGHIALALGYAATSIAAGYAAVALAVELARRTRRPA